MSCYLRHLEELFTEAGVVVTKDNRRRVDEAVHRLMGVEYKHCPEAWQKLKSEMGDPARRAILAANLKVLLAA